VILSPCGGYLPGLGPWHARTDEALYAHTPGLQVVMPSNPADAAGLLRYALRCRRPVIYLYPKALLHGAEGTVQPPDPECCVPFGRARTVRAGRDVTVVAWGNCVRLSEQAAREAAKRGVEAEIIDLRTIVPWDRRRVVESVAQTGRLLVVHEDNRTCGFGGEIVAAVVEEAFDRLKAPPLRVVRDDEHLAFQFDLELAILPSVEKILVALVELCRVERSVTKVESVRGASGRLPAPTALTAGAGADALRHDLTLQSELIVRVPKQSPTDEDSVLVRYLTEENVRVKAGVPLAEFEANKGTFEVESPADGTVLERSAREGERLLVGAPFLRLRLDEPATVEALGDEDRAETAPATSLPPVSEETLETIALSPAQKQIGALAMQSRLTIPHAAVDYEADVTEVEEERRRRKKTTPPETALPTLTHLVFWALVQALREERHAIFRGRFSSDASEMLVSPHVNVAFAAVSDKGDLFTPTMQKADLLSFAALSTRMRELTHAARTDSLRAKDLQGATVTLTNVGVFGASGGDPFVVPGQTAMLCMGALRVVWRFGETKPHVSERRLILPLRLVFDHRPFNGRDAAGLLRSVTERLTAIDPALWPHHDGEEKTDR
jgi:pyruvate/2-oxoglutarate dehydrogenase complex dihydrolipoamide acyltransferase (E2) component